MRLGDQSEEIKKKPKSGRRGRASSLATTPHNRLGTDYLIVGWCGHRRPQLGVVTGVLAPPAESERIPNLGILPIPRDEGLYSGHYPLDWGCLMTTKGIGDPNQGGGGRR
ncbi:hypothetical protein CRG98_010888 [Punica granatum]|uniref:Uncharacterized protein n=1 Tax=Punica granatum TaxID=22663 RepID=A0A2I0KK14_PUNGR|nr:hypothetical protein CRG98_010888 [Punica granatum]